MNDPGGKGAPKLGLLSVLVVEDSAFIRNVLTATLRTIGVGAVHAEAGGAEAIRFLEERRAALPPGTAPVDVIITDLVMPRLGGEAMIRQLRLDWPDLPIVVLSASPPEDGIPGLQDGEGGPLVILRKPVLAGELLTAMDQVFLKT